MFAINNNMIEYIGETNKYTQFIFNKKVTYGVVFDFKIKIVKTTSKYISIGVVDYEKQKN